MEIPISSTKNGKISDNLFPFCTAIQVQHSSQKGVFSVNDPSTYWLTFTNAALGVVVLICCIAVGVGVLQEVAAKRKKRAELSHLDREVAELVASFQDSHAFHTPGLGITMADGGEEIDKKEDQ